MRIYTRYSQNGLDIMDPKVEDILLEDIAHSLSHLCRFNGHCREFYSVGDHSLHVASELPSELKIYGLLHDAAEAYMGDIIAPLKQEESLSNLNYIELKLLDVIFEKFGLMKLYELGDHWNTVMKVDAKMLMTERRDLIIPPWGSWGRYESYKPYNFRIEPMEQGQVEVQFLETFRNLKRRLPSSTENE